MNLKDFLVGKQRTPETVADPYTMAKRGYAMAVIEQCVEFVNHDVEADGSVEVVLFDRDRRMVDLALRRLAADVASGAVPGYDLPAIDTTISDAPSGGGF